MSLQANLIPNGDGAIANADYYGALSRWESLLTNDGGASYVKWGDSSHATALCTAESDILPGCIISGVTIHAVRIKQASIVIYVDGELYESEIYTGPTWADSSNVWAVNPKTGLAWTPEEIAFLQFGIKLYANEQNEGEATQVYAVVDYDLPTAPTSPTGLSGGVTERRQVNLSWVDESDNEQGFHVERATAVDGPWETINSPPAGTESYEDTDTEFSTRYWYRVSAWNYGGESAATDAISVLTDNPGPPNAPTDLTATAISLTRVQLTWADQTAYEAETEVLVSLKPGGPWKIAAVVGAGIESYVHGGRQPNTTYYYAIRARTAWGYSDLVTTSTRTGEFAMGQSKAISGLGTTIGYVSPAILVGEVVNVTPTAPEKGKIDVTHHGSPNGVKEYIGGLIEPGTISVEMNWIADDAGQAALMAHFYARGADELKLMEIVWPDGTIDQFFAMITKAPMPTGAPVDGKVPATMELQISGLHSLGTAASAGLTTPFFALSVGDASILPVKAADKMLYTASVVNGTAGITVTPTAALGVITVNGTPVASGSASGSIALAVGPNEVVITVTESGKTPVTYRIIITRASA